MELTFIVITKNNVAATQKIRYQHDMNKNPEEFFKNLDGFIHKYIIEFQKNNSSVMQSLQVADTDGNIIREISFSED